MDSLRITNMIKRSPVEKVFGFDDIKKIDWVWINRDVFNDIILAADEDDELDDEDCDNFLRMISDADFVDILRERFDEKGFVGIDADRFYKLDPQNKELGKDTTIFINRKYLVKLLIGFYDSHEWMLKAMALDLKGYHDRTLKELYKEFFEDNPRVIEEMAISGQYKEGSLIWNYDMETNTLVTSYDDKVITKWSDREATNRFEYLTKGV
ncbi:hypothetical protein [Alkalibacter mobilis]|uniref:hypothetical protein n=1 Tax=Alkalibacter mobilis TaxID=2787712 RepID=UPI0018A03F3E|nr:hypothetical protein [Alkalibacter mobilis]MBF7096870.1 hypothetical protein [Alkalibacter mobilis]